MLFEYQDTMAGTLEGAITYTACHVGATEICKSYITRDDEVTVIGV